MDVPEGLGALVVVPERGQQPRPRRDVGYEQQELHQWEIRFPNEEEGEEGNRCR